MQDDSYLQFIRPAVRSLPAQGRVVIEGVDHHMQWNESPFDFPSDLKEEVMDRFTRVAWAHYPVGLRPYALLEQLARHNGVQEEMVLAGPGSSSLIKAMVSVMVGSGDHMTILSPTFLLYRRMAHLLNATAHEVAADPRDDFALPVDDLIVTARTNESHLVALCAPNNPTGSVYGLDDLRRVADECGCLLMVDAAYVEFSGLDLTPLVHEFENVILLRTFSKAYGMAGLRVGYALAPAPLAQELAKNINPFPVSTFSEIAAQVALEHHSRFMENVDRVIAERTKLTARLNELPGIYVYPSGTNFILVRVGKRAQALAAHLRSEHKLLVNNMGGYPGMEDCLRVTIGTPAQNALFLQATRAFLADG